MFSMKWIAGMAFAVATASLFAPVSHAQKRASVPASDDEIFLAMRDAARNNDQAKTAELAPRLSQYPVPSYVEYYRLKPRVHLASVDEIESYLSRYQGSAIADRLRNDWLLELGRARNWAMFDEQYPKFVLDDDMQVKCYALMSRAVRNQDVADEARALLVSPQGYGEGCAALISTLAHNRQFRPADVWAQVRLIADHGYVSTIRRIAEAAGVSETALVQAVEKPDAVLKRGPGKVQSDQELFLVALGRSARSGTPKAVAALVAAAEAKQLSPQEVAIGWAQIALQSSLRLEPDAAVYWNRTTDAPLSAEAHQWRARTALRNGDWKLVKAAIEAMPAALRNEPTWTYWQARALKEEGKAEEAQKRFRTIADQTNFYGQLALEELNEPITAAPLAQPVAKEEIAPMAANEGFARAIRFFGLNMRFEGVREWNWQLRRMNERQLLAAAEYARQISLLDRMVNTSDRTRAEVDFTQRFPSPFRDIMQGATQKLGLDMAWVYGLIRQESRFVQHAQSHVGASGLMQVMPATAKYVARKIGLDGFTVAKMNDIGTNITLGTHYLSMVLNDLDGSQALATAAYNAGPGRPRAWRSTLTRSVEGAIFAESIPFSETRGYVKSVLSNATYYAALFENKPQSLKARLGSVAPKGFVPSELP